MAQDPTSGDSTAVPTFHGYAPRCRRAVSVPRMLLKFFSSRSSFVRDLPFSPSATRVVAAVPARTIHETHTRTPRAPIGRALCSGEATGDVVYVNYGRPEDFATLVDLGIDLSGKIALARYKQIFRGLKAMIAEEHGMAGVLVYSDPADDGYAVLWFFPGQCRWFAWRPTGEVRQLLSISHFDFC